MSVNIYPNIAGEVDEKFNRPAPISYMSWENQPDMPYSTEITDFSYEYAMPYYFFKVHL